MMNFWTIVAAIITANTICFAVMYAVATSKWFMRYMTNWTVKYVKVIEEEIEL